MAIYGVVFLGTTPIGAPIVGWVSQQFGPRAGLALGGVAILVTLVAFAAWQWASSRRRAAMVDRPQERPNERIGLNSQDRAGSAARPQGDASEPSSKDRAGCAGPVLRG